MIWKTKARDQEVVSMLPACLRDAIYCLVHILQTWDALADYPDMHRNRRHDDDGLLPQSARARYDTIVARGIQTEEPLRIVVRELGSVLAEPFHARSAETVVTAIAPIASELRA